MSETSDVSRHYVYILRSLNDDGLYIGFTTDLKGGLTAYAKVGFGEKGKRRDNRICFH